MEDLVEGLIIRTEVEVHIVLVRYELRDAPYHSEVFFFGRRIVSLCIREREAAITDRSMCYHPAAAVTGRCGPGGRTYPR